jgi:hypothetical protein
VTSAISRGMGILAAMGMMLGGLVVPGVAALPPPAADAEPVVPVVAVTPVRALPLVVSKSGRYVVQVVGGRLELRDLRKDKRLKRFPAGAQASSVSISDNGRYVTYTVPGKGKTWDRTRRDIRVYDRKTGRTRSAATTRSGKSLKPKWRTTCVGDLNDPNATSATVCDEGIPLTAAPQLDGGQISGNGRYIAFCANYIRPDRVDLYIKNWRTKSLKRINGACSYSHDEDVGWDWILAPMVSENGSVILLPGAWRYGEDGDGCWEPSRALVKRREWTQVGGRAPTMTHDGQLVSTVGLPTACDDYSAAAHIVWWFDLGTRTGRPADEPGLRVTMRNASRHGRYVTWFEYSDQPMDPVTGRYPGERWLIWDRTTGQRFDLGAALLAAGYEPRLGGVWYGHGPSVDYPLMTGDGRTVFLDTDRGAVAVRWSPSA